MLRILTSHLLLSVVLLGLFVSSTSPVFANNLQVWTDLPASTKSFTSATADENPKPNQETLSGNTLTFIQNYANLTIFGGEVVARGARLNEEEARNLRENAGPGLIGHLNRGIIATYTPPATTQTYLADLMKSAKIIPAAQAQGLGFSALDPILETWKAFRNVAYLFFVVIFLVIGFMIMLRTKVGQAAITAQQAIPSVVVAMLAVTFSYAIAGLMIDLMYVIMYMLASFFSEGPDVITRNMLGLVGLMFQGTDGVQETIEQFMEDALNIGWLGEALAWLSSLLGSVIVGVAVLFASFKVFFELIKTYVAVLVQIIFSPIILMFGAIPGKNTFGKWIKDLAGNLLIWPVVLLCILVQRMLTAPIRALQGTGNTLDSAFGGGFMPPFLIGQGQGAILPVIVGLGVLLVIPEIIQQVKKAMGVEDGVFGALAGSAWGQLRAVPQKAKSAATVGIPLGYSVAEGLPQMIRAGKDYKAATGETGNVVDMFRVMTKGGPINPNDENSPHIDGYRQGAARGFSRGARVNEDLQNTLSGKNFTRNTAEELARRQLEELNKGKSKASTSSAAAPADGKKSTT